MGATYVVRLRLGVGAGEGRPSRNWCPWVLLPGKLPNRAFWGIIVHKMGPNTDVETFVNQLAYWTAI